MYELHAVSPEGHASYQLVRAATLVLAELARTRYLPVMNDDSKIEIHKVPGCAYVERGDIASESGTEIVDVYVLYGYVDGQIIGPRIQKRFRAELDTHLGVHVTPCGASLGALSAEAAEAGRAFLKVLAMEGCYALQKEDPDDSNRWED